MKKLDRPLLLCYFAAVALGCGLHFLFSFWPSILTEFIAPVNESVWEHLKLVFWPLMLAGAFLTGTGRWRTAPWLLSLLLCCGLLLGAGWYLNCVTGAGDLGTNLALYFVTMGLGFFLPAVLPIGERWNSLLTGAVILLAGLIVCWTIQPPDAVLFRDLSLADAAYLLPW
ncbi:MAG: DUF6512 family protein [Clostridiales bacterium]|nr:DUF6512 family protein [Clostridiales bacterium]